MSEHATVRTATNDDVPVVQDVARRSWEAVYEGVLADEVVDAMLEGGYSEAVLESLVAADEAALFVATVDEEVVGYASAEPTDDGEGKVSVYVDPDHWQAGIGSLLLDRACAFLATRGIDRVRDSVLARNEVGNAFYGDHFERVDERTVEIAGEEFVANVYAGTTG